MAELDSLNDKLKHLKSTLSQDQKDQLDDVLADASEVWDSLRREFDDAFESGGTRKAMKYRQGKFAMVMIR